SRVRHVEQAKPFLSRRQRHRRVVADLVSLPPLAPPGVLKALALDDVGRLLKFTAPIGVETPANALAHRPLVVLRQGRRQAVIGDESVGAPAWSRKKGPARGTPQGVQQLGKDALEHGFDFCPLVERLRHRFESHQLPCARLAGVHRRSSPFQGPLSNDEMDVAKLVPEVTSRDGFFVDVHDGVTLNKGTQHGATSEMWCKFSSWSVSRFYAA